jgi:hypothetical protein
VMMPTAEIQVRQALPHRSAGPSMRRSNRIDGGSASSVGRSAANAGRQLDPNAKIPIRDRIMLSSSYPGSTNNIIPETNRFIFTEVQPDAPFGLRSAYLSVGCHIGE